MDRTVALALALLTVASAAVRADGEFFTLDAARWGTAALPREAGGGDRGVPLSVTVHNVGTTDYNSATARLLSTDGLSVTVPGGDVASLTERFTAGSAWEATFRVDVDEEAKAGGPLDVRVELTVWKAGASDEETLSTEVRVTGRTEVSVAPADPVLPGGASVDVPVRVANDGDGATGPVSVVLSPAAGSGLLLAGDDAWTTEALGPGASTTLHVPVRTPSTRGPHALTATVSYLDAAGAAVVGERTLAFQVSAAPRGPLRIDLATPGVVAGKNATLEFRLENSGPDEIRHLDLSAAGAGGTAPALSTTGGGALLAPSTLAPGATATARLPVLAALAAEDLAEITVEASYLAGGSEHEESYDFAVPIVQGVELRLLALHVLEGDVSGIVVNTGTGTAWNPRAMAGAATAVLSEDLAPNDAVSFRVPGAGAAAGPLALTFDWNDERGGVHSAVVRGEARDAASASQKTLPAPFWASALAALAAVAALRRRG